MTALPEVNFFPLAPMGFVAIGSMLVLLGEVFLTRARLASGRIGDLLAMLAMLTLLFSLYTAVASFAMGGQHVDLGLVGVGGVPDPKLEERVGDLCRQGSPGCARVGAGVEEGPLAGVDDPQPHRRLLVGRGEGAPEGVEPGTPDPCQGRRRTSQAG